MMPSPAWRSVPSGRGLSYQRTSWPCCCQRIHKSRAFEPISITRMRILYSHFATAIVVVTTWETHMKLVLALLLAAPLAANAYCPITNDWRANAQCQQEEY